MKRFLLALLLALPMAATGATKYVQLDSNYYHSQAGTSSSDPWGGAMGVYRFSDSAAAGDTCLMYGATHGKVYNILKIAYDDAAGTWARGDTVNNQTRAGVAIVYTDYAANDTLLCWLVSGSFLDNDSIQDVDVSAQADVKGTPTRPGLILSKTGTAAAMLHFIGVNSSWAIDDSTVDTMSGNLVSPVIIYSGTVNHIQWRNISFYKSSGSGLTQGATTNYYFIFYNCHFLNNAIVGITSIQSSLYDKCRANFNGIHGMSTMGYSQITNCEVIGNGTTGIYNSSPTIVGCVIAKNTTNGVTFNPLGTIVNSVVDSNGTGITITTNGTTPAIIKCRITNNATSPITVIANQRLYERDNIILGNGNGNAILKTGKCYSNGTSVYTGTAGYVDRANNDYSTKSTATYRRIKSKVGGK